MIRICISPARGRTFAALLALGAALSCSDSTAPDPTQKNSADLHILKVATTAPAFEATTVSFWAKKGADREIRVRFTTGEDFMRFRVPANALLARPDGTAFAVGDSVLITITVTDPTRLAADFQPAGLKFSPAAPARLQWEFGEADDDLNDDGVVNASDVALIPQLAIWRQELVGAPWLKLSSVVEVQLNEVEADITSFTGYALAY